jgi:branched-subunit amino acid transport protein
VRIWLCIAVVTIGTWLMKASGPLVLGERKLAPVAVRMTTLAAPVLLAGLIVTDLGGQDWNGFEWTKLAGVVATGLAHLLRAPMLLSVVVGIVTTVLLRALQG